MWFRSLNIVPCTIHASHLTCISENTYVVSTCISEKNRFKETSARDFTLRSKDETMNSFVVCWNFLAHIYFIRYEFVADVHKSRSTEINLSMRVINWFYWLNKSNCTWEISFTWYAGRVRTRTTADTIHNQVRGN